MSHRPPLTLPANETPFLDLKNGILNPAWRGFFSNLVADAPPIDEVTADPSPMSYTAIHPGYLFLRGGFITGLNLTRARVTLSLLPSGGTLGMASFSAVKAGNQGGILSATETLITFPTEEWDDGAFFASNAWTPPAGKVALDAGVHFDAANMVDGASVYLTFYKNGAELKRGTTYRIGAANAVVVIGSIIDEADGDDFYEVYAFASGAGNKTVLASVGTFFQGHMLGAAGDSGLGQFIPMAAKDELEITYTSAPSLWFIAGGNPT